MTTLHRNTLCLCGSGRKVKFCHPYLTNRTVQSLDAEVFRLPSTLPSVINTSNADHEVIIMAGGQGSRWSHEESDSLRESTLHTSPYENKLFVPIDGQPLLHRTVEQLQHLGITNPWIYNIEDELPLHSRRFVAEHHHLDITDALAESRSLWTRPVSILLGDVVWSDQALRRVMEAQPVEWRFFGKRGKNVFTSKPWGEIYALRFCSSQSSSMLNAIHTLHSSFAWRKKLWELYRALLGVPIPTTQADRRYILHPPTSPFFCDLPDWTDDIDQMSDYYNLVRHLERQKEVGNIKALTLEGISRTV